MKRNPGQLCIVILMLLTLGVGLPTFGQTKYDLTGDWKIDLDKSVGLFDKKQKEFYDSLPSESKQRYKQGFSSRTLRFSSMDKVEVFLTREGQQTIIPGTWTLDDASGALVLHFPSGPTRYVIADAKKKMIILKVADPEDERGKAVFSQLYLEKQNE